MNENRKKEVEKQNVAAKAISKTNDKNENTLKFDIETTTNKWKNLSQWLHCMCVVTFDLNLGQALEYVYPPEFRPTEQEISNICYMAFPDSNSGCMGDTKFHMRLRVAPDVKQSESSCEIFKQTFDIYNHECESVMRADASHYWGFVYFRQKRDATLPRGYFQKSFILITRLPYFNLYYELLEQLAQLYFDEGNCVLQQACLQIAHEWPRLQAGMTLRLPLYNELYEVLIPKASSRKTNDATALGANTNNGCKLLTPTKCLQQVHELELFRSLSFIVDNLYTLWELVLTAEPIVVIGTSPADCSHMVQTLVALIQPLEYCAEARPYFTIHDSEFKEFTRESSNKSTPSVILGVTNPFFIKLLKHWPHMLRLVDNQVNYQQQKQLQQSSRNQPANASFSNNGNSTQNSVKNIVNLSTDGSTPGLHTKYKPFLKKDKTFIKKVLLGIKMKRPEHVQTALLRRHLLELTQSFRIPLERYMASLMPLQKDISPFKSAPNANAFKLDDFLTTLELSGPQLTSPLKGDWKGLYKRFFDSANFRGWYLARRRELQLTLQDLQLQALSEANLEVWARDKQEVEIIDMILKLKQKLNLYADTGNNNESIREQIRSQINCMKELLPQDLKNVVNI